VLALLGRGPFHPSDAISNPLFPHQEIFIISTIGFDTPRSALDKPAWQALCEKLTAQAVKTSGCFYDLYVERFSSAIDMLS